MLDPNAGRYCRLFMREFQIAQRVLQPYGGALAWSRADFEAFVYVSEQACITFHPGTGRDDSPLLRMRDRASADRRLAAELMIRLEIGAGDHATFTQRADNAYYSARHRFLSTNKIRPGWAARGIHP